MTTQAVIAAEIDYLIGESNPFDSLQRTIATDVSDWSQDRVHAWVYGIILGWDGADGDDTDTDTGAYDELQRKFGWTTAELDRLKSLHAAFHAAQTQYEAFYYDQTKID